MKPFKRFKTDGANACADICFDKFERLAIASTQLYGAPDVERRVRPGRLRQILDRSAYAAVALD
jgi:hypothetical protein